MPPSRSAAIPGSLNFRPRITGTFARTCCTRDRADDMPEPKKSRWRIFRIYFRRCRIAFLLFLLALLCALIALDQVGLPNYLKPPLVDRLHASGIDLQFSRLRWRWYRGIVAENVRFGQTESPTAPKLSAEQVEVHLNGNALSHL